MLQSQTNWKRCTAVAIVACAGAAHAQTFKFAEDFEAMGITQTGQQGPQGLIQRGWTFRNQSSQATTFPAWSEIQASGWPQSGAGYLRGSSSAVGGFVGQQMSHWAILPPIPSLGSGDEFSLWVLDGAHGSVATYIEVRRSPSGGTSTGSGPFDVGDFTEVVYSAELPINAPPVIYQQVRATLAGGGRLAIRFHAPNIHSIGGVTANMYLDTLTIGEPPAPPCGLVMPSPGQTIIWDAAGSPYTICNDFVIPVGGTIEVLPGAVINFENERRLIVEGTLRVLGNASNPVIINGDNISGPFIQGSAEIKHADVTSAITVRRGGSLTLADSVLREQAWLSSAGHPTFVRVMRTEIQSLVASFGSTNVIEDVTITNPGSLPVIRGHWRINGLESVASIVFGTAMQDRVIDNVTITGVTQGPALDLQPNVTAAEFHLGANNTITGNQYPVWARFGGLTHDSVVPQSGNANNAIRGPVNTVSALRSRVSLPNFGVPYHFLERGRLGGDVEIEPGTTLQFGPMGGLTIAGDNGMDGKLRGLPGRPIVLERLDPNQAWFSLATGPGWPIFEHLDISGAGVGVVGNEAELWLRDTVIHDCDIGAYPSTDGNIYGTGVQFLRNQLGLRDDPFNPAGQIKTGVHFSGVERANIFEGNTLAAKNFGTTQGQHHPFPVDNNWWGHESGPFEPLFHPQGQGDEISPFVQFQPFRTQRPDLADQRPVVRLKTRVHPAVIPGEKIIIEWDAFDDGQIVSFDVVMLDPNTNLPPGFHFIPLGEDLPGTQRSFEIVVPDVGLHPYERFPFRIVATDNAGQTSFEQFWLSIPHQRPSANVAFLTPLSGMRGGEDIQVCFDATAMNTTPRFYIETAADDRVSMSASTSQGCSLGTVRMPFASSDRVRLALRAEGNWNRDEWYFTDYFTIRPDPRIGDAPPQVTMTSPAPGATYTGGQVIPITWDANDDHGLREFRIQASFNAGYTYHTIATRLPGATREYRWQLPASTGIDDVRVRVVAVDTLMQNTSHGDTWTFDILPGTASCYADCDPSAGPGVLDIFDFLCFGNRFHAGDPYACDCDLGSGPGVCDIFDFLCFGNAFNAGCP